MGSFRQNSNKEGIALKQLIDHLYKNVFEHVPVLVQLITLGWSYIYM